MKRFWISILFFLLVVGIAYAIVTESVTPKTDNTYDLGNATHRYQDLYLSGNINMSTVNTIIYMTNGTICWKQSCTANMTYNGTHMVING